MTSILTNSSAMVALQTLKSINGNLNKVQSEISTGKVINTSRDNSAIWAISKVMESDVKGFKGINDSLELASSTISVAAAASSSITGFLTDMKEKIVAAQSENVDRTKLQTDVVALRDQITSVVKAAQFNGLNLVNGSVGSINVLSSLDRSAGTVTSSSIAVAGQNLGTSGFVAKTAFATHASVNMAVGGAALSATLTATTGTATVILGPHTGPNAFVAGDKLVVRIGDKEASYTVQANDLAATSTPRDLIAIGLKDAIDSLGITGLNVAFSSTNAGQIVMTNTSASPLTMTAHFSSVGSGGLSALNGIDVSNTANAAAALGSIETMLQTAINATASFGSVQGRIDKQLSFVSELTNAMSNGIATLVEADMEEASARLQALQVQQQLGIQALSIANQQPQALLSLFR